MHSDIIRYGSTPMGTFGELITWVDMDASFSAYTMERPWLNNQAMISCFPAGDYTLVPHESKRYGKTFAIVGETVSHFPEDGKARSTCLVHSANHMNHVKGCVGLGEALGFVQGQWAVLNSSKTVKEWLKLLNSSEGSHTLSVKWANQSL